jgi:hypothetical protein
MKPISAMLYAGSNALCLNAGQFSFKLPLVIMMPKVQEPSGSKSRCNASRIDRKAAAVLFGKLSICKNMGEG